ncbi:putative ribonuclease H-like domain-containing protein [Tanacetum coccineum]
MKENRWMLFAFGGNPTGGKITGKGTIKSGNLDFENVYFVRELKFNLFSISQICDKKNSVLFNDTECIVLSPNFKLIDESQVSLRVPRNNKMYSVDLKNIVPKRGLTFLFAKSISDESKLWHRRLCHLNFKTINKLVKGNLVRGLPSKLFENDQTCVACQKGKQHRASFKSKTKNSISLPLHMLHMDLLVQTVVKTTKDETSGILNSFITGIENLVDHNVKVIRYDNRTEFKNREMNQFCEMKGILRQYSVARTPQQNSVAERRNKTLIEAARTMLADSKFSESIPNVVGSGPDWLFDIDALTRTVNYKPIVACTQSNSFVDSRKDSESIDQEKDDNVNSTNNVNVASTNEVNVVGGKKSIELPDDPNMPALEDISIFDLSRDNEDVGAKADMHLWIQQSKRTQKGNSYIERFKLDRGYAGRASTIQATRSLTLYFVDFTKWKKGYRIEAIRLFLAYASFKDFVVYHIDVKSAFLYGNDCKKWCMQKKDGIFISQDNYVGQFLNKFGFTKVKTTSTPIETQKPLLKDEDGEKVDVHMYRSMIGSLMYLTSSRPDIMYLKGQPKLGLWYPKDSPFDLVAYTDSDYARASLDRKSTTGEKAKKSVRLIMEKLVIRENRQRVLATVKEKTINGEVQLQALVDGKKIIITESIVRRDLQLEDAEGVDCLPNATIFEQLTLMGSKTTAWNEFSSTMASAIICLATNQKFNFSKYIFESMVKNLDNVFGIFLMYLRFVQVFVNQQLEGMPTYKRIYIAPSHTKKKFGNMRRIGKDEAVNEEMDESLERAATTATGLEAEKDSGNIDKTQSKATLNEPSSSRTSSGSGPRRQETMGDTIAQTRSENVSKHSNDPLLARVLNLETTKTTQANEIASLKMRVKKLEQKKRSRTHGLKRLYKVGSSRRVESSDEEGLGEEDASKQEMIADIDANEDIYLVIQTDEDMFGVNDLDGDEVIVESVDVVNTAEETRSVVEEVTAVTIPVSAATTTTTTTAITDVEMTLAQALAELKSAKPKADKVVIQEPEQGTTTPTLTTTTDATTITAVSTRPRAKGLVIHKQEQAPKPTVSSQQPSQVNVQDKGKGKMVKPEPVKKMSKKELLMLDEELAFKLQAEEEEERLSREKAQQVEEANIAWDDIQAKIDAGYQLAQRLQAQEQDELTDEENARLTELVEESSKKAEAEIAHESSLKRAGEELE